MSSPNDFAQFMNPAVLAQRNRESRLGNMDRSFSSLQQMAALRQRQQQIEAQQQEDQRRRSERAFAQYVKFIEAGMEPRAAAGVFPELTPAHTTFGENLGKTLTKRSQQAERQEAVAQERKLITREGGIAEQVGQLDQLLASPAVQGELRQRATTQRGTIGQRVSPENQPALEALGQLSGTAALARAEEDRRKAQEKAKIQLDKEIKADAAKIRREGRDPLKQAKSRADLEAKLRKNAMETRFPTNLAGIPYRPGPPTTQYPNGQQLPLTQQDMLEVEQEVQNGLQEVLPQAPQRVIDRAERRFRKRENRKPEPEELVQELLDMGYSL